MHKKVHCPLIFGTLFPGLLISSQSFADKSASFNDFIHGNPQNFIALYFLHEKVSSVLRDHMGKIEQWWVRKEE